MNKKRMLACGFDRSKDVCHECYMHPVDKSKNDCVFDGSADDDDVVPDAEGSSGHECM